MSSSVPNPTGVLQTALGEFQSILSDNDRKRLQKIKNKPEVDAAIQFTATLDQANAAERKGPSISSRLYSFLLSIQQFSDIVDTFVSSNPAIAALVWGTVKLTMLIIANFLTYYEEMSKAFLDFGRWSPQFSEYQRLFPKSTRLQTAICEFYVAIIRCCKQIVSMSQRSWQAQLVNSLTQSFQSELETQVRLIKNTARDVRFEIQLAKAQSDIEEQQLQRQERTLALGHRSSLISFISTSQEKMAEAQRWRAIVDRRDKAENDQRRLDHISTFDHVTAFNHARSKRYHSTGGWVFRTPEWCRWKDGDSSSVFWLSGKIGSGKTVLSATITDHLLATRQVSESISFIFPRFDYADSLLADIIIRSLIRQNLQPDLVDRLSTEISKACNSFYSQNTMLDLLVSKTTIFSTNYLLIDSLDDCESKDRHTILQILGDTIKASTSKVKLFIASRDALESEIADIFPQATRLRMNSPEATSDLELFARQTLSERMNMGQLVIGNVVSFDMIYNAIVGGAQGMFLWVALEIDDICSQVCEEDVLIALQNLPTTLTGILTRALLRILAQGSQNIAKEAFKWISVAKRPLLLDELQDALSVKIGESYSKPERRPERIEKLPAWTANLLEIDELSKSVQFIHHTVRTFILDTSIIDPQFPEVNQFHNSVDDLDTAVGELCVTYLEWNDFKTALQRLNPQVTTTKVPNPQKIIKTALAAEWSVTATATIGRLIPQFPKNDIQLKFDQNVGSSSNEQKQGREEVFSRGNSYPFLEYAKKYWILHTRLLTIASPIYSSWGRMLEGTSEVARTEWTRSEFLSADESILVWAQTHQHFAIFYALLSRGCLSLDRLHECLFKMIARNPSLEGVRISLKNIRELTPRRWTEDMLFRMEMAIAAAYLLSQAHIDLRQQPQDWSNLKTYRPQMLLLDNKFNIDAIADVPGLLKMIYFASVQLGYAALMAMLLVREPTFCFVPEYVDIQPLQVAIMAENITAVNLLLHRGADPNQVCTGEGLNFAKPYDFQLNSLLHLATCQKNTTIMRLLLEYGADIKAQRFSKRVPMEGILVTTAVNSKEYDSSEYDSSEYDSSEYQAPETPEGRIRVTIETRVESRASIQHYILPKQDKIAEVREMISSEDLAPLHCAVLAATYNRIDGPDLKPMKLLLRYGADPNVSTSAGFTPLYLAANLFQSETFEALLKAGADPAVRCGNGDSVEDYVYAIEFHQGKELIEQRDEMRERPRTRMKIMTYLIRGQNIK